MTQHSVSGLQTSVKRAPPSEEAEDAEGAAGDLEVGNVVEAAREVLEAGAEATMSRPEKKSTVGSQAGSVSAKASAEEVTGVTSGDLQLPNLSRDVKQASVPHVVTGSRSLIKWVAVATLLFQNAGTNVIMPLARRTEWNAQSGVICQEIAKGAVCVLALLWGGGFSNLAGALRPTPEALKTAIPALLYLFENNLRYIAADYLSPTLFAVLYQLKILTTALLMVLLLQKKISCRQWAAIAILIVGAVLVLLGHIKPKKGKHKSNESDLWRGVVVVLMGTCLSGLAGVYFEKLLKGSTVTLAARNLQLAFYSTVIGCLIFSESGDSFRNFFNGYTAMVWVSLCNNAFGGLTTAVIIKYADNIWKNIATTMAIVLTSFVQALFLGGSLGSGAMLGVALVITAVLLYSGVCTLELGSLRAVAKGYRPAALTSGKSPAAQLETPGESPQVIGSKAVPGDALSD